jgi:cation diffusion facilitator CzcD-associated flavoprotein CzcO
METLQPNHICHMNGYNRGDAYTYIPVVIVGAGESGIAMGYKLKKDLGFDQFRIFDRQSGIGGTWWINRYPGVACDV